MVLGLSAVLGKREGVIRWQEVWKTVALSCSLGFQRVGIYLPDCFELGLATAGWSAPFIASRAGSAFWSPWVCVGRRSDDLAVLLKWKKKPCFGACFSSS